MKKILWVLCIAATLTTPAYASSTLYCRITSINNVASDGSLDKISNNEDRYGGFAYADGTEFTINRKTGAMQGPHVVNDSFMWENHIIDSGDDKNSFKMFVRNRLGAKKAQYIDVRLWVDEPQKPFVLVADRVTLGYCTYQPQKK